MTCSVHAPRRRGAASRRVPRVASLAAALAAALALVGGGVPAVSSPAPVAAVTCPSSLQALIDATPSGGTVTVPPCTYHQSLQVKRSITIHASGATIDGDNTRSTGVVVTGDDVTIDGLTVTRVHSDSHVGAVNLQAGDRFTFRNGVIRDSSTVCLGMHGGAHARVTNTELTGCGKEGYFLNGMSDSLLDHNRIHHNNMALAYDWFVEAGGGKTMASTRVTFDQNEVAFNRGPGIWFDVGAKNAVITGNRVHDNDREGIFFEISSGATITGNSVWNNGWSYSPWGWGAGISVSSSDGAAISGNTVAWNARGISVISQARELSPHDHDTVKDNIIISAKGNRVAGWYDDHGGSLFASGNANSGSGDRYWVGDAEPTDYRFEWNGGCKTLACYNGTRGEEGASYLTTSERDAALGAAGIPSQSGSTVPPPGPRAGDPRISVGGPRLGARSVPAKISWTPIAIANADQVQLQRDGGSWTTLRLASPRSHSVGAALAPGHHYRARLRIRTAPSRWSAWATTATVVPGRYQERTSLATYGSGTWHRTASAGASGGHVRSATKKGAVASFRFTGRAVGWVATLGPSRGSARVYVDGKYRATIGLHAGSRQARRIVFRASWAASGSHTLLIRVNGTAHHPRVDVDAFAVIR
jgi:parallel beta-helix repeat protein